MGARKGLREHAVGTSPGRGASEQVKALWVGRSHIWGTEENSSRSNVFGIFFVVVITRLSTNLGRSWGLRSWVYPSLTPFKLRVVIIFVLSDWFIYIYYCYRYIWIHFYFFILFFNFVLFFFLSLN